MIKGVGIGLRHRHYRDFMEGTPETPWLEVHTENFFSPATSPSAKLLKIRERYPLSAHGVGLSLGSADNVSETHLEKIKDFISRYSPDLISEHLSWGAVDGIYLNDLLPLPYTEEALASLCRNIEQTQDYLKRRILIENPSSYMQFKSSEIEEADFLVEAAERSGCGILLDVNNIYVSAVNHGFSAEEYIEKIPPALVGEIHLAGYAEGKISEKRFLIDNHGSKVFPDVWKLYEKAVKRFGRVPALIEWDSFVPELEVLLAERKKAEEIMNDILAGEKHAA